MADTAPTPESKTPEKHAKSKAPPEAESAQAHTAEGDAAGDKAEKKEKRKKIKRSVPKGIAHVHSSFNNTIVTITDTNGDVLAWASGGTMNFKGSRKGTPFAAQRAAADPKPTVLNPDLRPSWSLTRAGVPPRPDEILVRAREPRRREPARA